MDPPAAAPARCFDRSTLHPGSRGLLALVDDDATTRRALGSLLADEGWRVETFGSAEEALGPLAQRPFDALVTYNVLPGIRGLELARRAQTARAGLRCAVISGSLCPEGVEVPWFLEPVNVDALFAMLAGD